jgi:hypothetical protein
MEKFGVGLFAIIKPMPLPPDELPFWKRKAMRDMTAAEWESLCEGCGLADATV